MNLMNGKAFYRTASATPGLLKICVFKTLNLSMCAGSNTDVKQTSIFFKFCLMIMMMPTTKTTSPKATKTKMTTTMTTNI